MLVLVSSPDIITLEYYYSSTMHSIMYEQKKSYVNQYLKIIISEPTLAKYHPARILTLLETDYRGFISWASGYLGT